MILWWKRPNREKEIQDEELIEARAKANELAKRTAKLLRENNLASDIRKALGAPS